MAHSTLESDNRKIRVRVFLRMLKQNLYPNYNSLNLQVGLEHSRAGGFTRQTLYRDVEYLKSLGAKIEYDHSERNGYYLLNRNWNGYASFMDADEMEAAVLGAQFAERILPASELREKIRGSVDSLWAGNFLPDGHSEIQWNSLVIQGLPVRIDPQVFQIVFEQWRSQHNVEITYMSAKRKKAETITIEPHILTFCNGIWYVRGKSLTPWKRNPKHRDFLTFALHRISSAKRVGSLFEPDIEEIDAVNKDGAFDFPRTQGIRLRASGMGLRQVLESFPVKDTVYSDPEHAEIDLEDVEEYKVVNLVMVSGGSVQVIEPEFLKMKVLEQARSLVMWLENF